MIADAWRNRQGSEGIKKEAGRVGLPLLRDALYNLLLVPPRSEKRNRTRNTTKHTLATMAAVPAINPKPSTPASTAMMRKMIA
jgi:hypothetical protein